MFGAGPVFDELLSRLHDMGVPPRSVTWGRINGSHDVYIQATLPVGTTERVAPTLDACATAILTLDLSCADRDQQAAQESLT